MRLTLIAGLCGLFASPVSAIELGMPLDCTYGVDCIIQNYVDTEPGPEVADHECGSLSYDNHQGTDFRLLSEAKIADGYEVLATAPGIVRQVIQNQHDHGFRGAQENPLSCGNAVMIEHADGWSSQYCHLAENSVTVELGARVERGDKLALLGSSGGTDFPHLHYALRRYGITVDPFTGVSPTGCDALEAGTHWAEETGIGYVGSAVMGFGVSGVFPSKETVLHDPARLVPPVGEEAAVYTWFKMLGMKEGDSLRITVLDAEGRPFANELFGVDRDETIVVINVGVTPEDLDLEAWPEGTYQARMELYGGAQLLQQETLRFTLPEGSAENIAIGGEG